MSEKPQQPVSLEAINVLVRVRPFDRSDETERAEEEQQMRSGRAVVATVDGANDSISVLKAMDSPRLSFRFTGVLGSDKTNKDLTEPLVGAVAERVVAGKNAAVLAYGSTGSGKTYTMFNTAALDTDPTQLGLAYALVQRLLERENNELHLTLSCSVMEVYNEHLRCLLTGKALSILVDNVVYQDNKLPVKKLPVASTADFVTIVALSESTRQTGKTNMNEHSSRSHLILQLDVEVDRDGDKFSPHILLVDLAGSETADGLDGSDDTVQGQRGEEGKHINQSLLALSRLIRRAAETKGDLAQRDILRADARASKLTRLVRSCVAGNSYTSFVMCLSPLTRTLSSTVKTLLLAQTLCGIRNHVKPQLVPSCERLAAENARLRRRLKTLVEGGTSPGNGDEEAKLLETVAELERRNAKLQDELDLSRQLVEDSTSLKAVAVAAVKRLNEAAKIINRQRTAVERRSCEGSIVEVQCEDGVLVEEDGGKSSVDVSTQVITEGGEEAMRSLADSLKTFEDVVTGVVSRLNSYREAETRGDGSETLRSLEAASMEQRQHTALLTPLLSIVENTVTQGDIERTRKTLQEMRETMDKTSAAFTRERNQIISLARDICTSNRKLGLELDATGQQLAETMVSLENSHERLRESNNELACVRKEAEAAGTKAKELEEKVQQLEAERASLNERLSNNSELYGALLKQHMELIGLVQDPKLRQKYADVVHECNTKDIITLSLKLQKDGNALETLKGQLARMKLRKERMETYYRECLKNLVKLNKAVAGAFGVDEGLQLDLEDLYHNSNIVKASNFIVSHWNFLRSLKERDTPSHGDVRRFFVLGRRGSKVADDVATFLSGNEPGASVTRVVTDDLESLNQFKDIVSRVRRESPFAAISVVLADGVGVDVGAVDRQLVSQMTCVF